MIGITKHWCRRAVCSLKMLVKFHTIFPQKESHMKKSNFQKLALMGIVGGTLVAQAPVAATEATTNTPKGTTIAGGCHGSGNCSGQHPTYPISGGSSCGGKPQPRQYNEPRYTADANMDMNSGRMMSESELMSQLNENGKTTYRNLDAEGKALALKFAGQSNFQDKNDAVRAAADQIAQKRASMNTGSSYR